MHLVISISYLTVLLELSGLGSDSIVMAWAGQLDWQSLHAMHLTIRFCKILLPFLSGWVSSERVLSSEQRGQRRLLERIVDGPLGLKSRHKAVDYRVGDVLWVEPGVVESFGHIAEIEILWLVPSEGVRDIVPGCVIDNFVVVIFIVVPVAWLSVWHSRPLCSEALDYCLG